MYRKSICFALGIMLVWLSGCSGQKSHTATATEDTPPDEVLISIGSKVLTYGQAARQVELRLGGPPPTSMDPDRINMIERRTLAAVVDDFIRRELLLAEAHRLEIAPKEENITAAIQAIESTRRAGAPPPAGMYYDGPDSLRQEVVAGLTIEKLLTQELAPFPQPSETEITTYLERYPDRRRMPATARARHIFLPVDPNAEPNHVAQQKKQLEDIRARLRQGADFAQTASMVSQDAAAARGGNLGVLVKGRSDPILEQAVFSQAIDAIGPIVRSSVGLHIIQVQERTEARLATHQDIIKHMRRNHRAEVVAQYINELRSQTEIRHAPALQPVPNAAR